MKTIYIHIGVGKTGTTTIQRFMATHYHHFSNQGIRFMQAGGGQSGMGHQNFAKSFIPKLPHYMMPPKDGARQRELISNELLNSRENSILLSSENFPLTDPQRVRKFFESTGKTYHFKIILFVRSQDELAESEYNQLIKVRSEKRSLSEYIDSEFDADFYSLASSWETVFGSGNIICKVFDASESSVIDDFLDCLPVLSRPAVQTNPTHQDFSNQSLGCAALTMKRMLNVLQPLKDKQHFELPTELRETFKDIDIPAILMNSKKAAQVRQRFNKSNQQLSKHFLHFCDTDLGGRRYSDEWRDLQYDQCKNLTSCW